MHTIGTVCIGAAVAAFALYGLGLKLGVSLVWIGVALLVAGVYLVPRF